MYTIKLIDTIIHDERTVFVGNPVLTRKLNKAGTLTFTITKDNPGYDRIKPRFTYIFVYRGESAEPLWTGVALTYSLNMYGDKEVICEGVLSMLNDVSCTVFSYDKDTLTVSEYFTELQPCHNEMARGEFRESFGVCFGEQNYVGRMHIYLQYSGGDPGSYGELFSTNGVTAEELSNKVIYVPLSSRKNIWVTYDPEDTGETSQPLKIGNLFPTTHAASNYFEVSPPTMTGYDAYLMAPDTSYDISTKKPYATQLLANNGPRGINTLRAHLKTIGNTVMVSKAFKDSFCSSMEKLNKIIDRFGGYVKANAQDYGGIDVDYYEDFSESCGQKITLGDNLEEYMESVAFENIYNRITPFGKNKGTSFLWDYVTIESVNGDCLSITNDESASIYGAIQKVVHYNDVGDPAELLKLAKRDLNKNLDFELSLAVKAADKSMIEADKQAFDIGLLTEITIPPLNITRNLICTSIVNHLSEPEKDEYTFGSIPQTSTSYVASGNTSGTTSNGNDIAILSTSGSVSSQFNLLNSEVYRIGDCVFVSLKLKNEYSMSAGNSKVCYTLPAGYHPTKEANIMAAVNTNNCVTGWIRTNGDVVVLSNYAMAVGTEIRVMAYFYMGA